MVVWPNNIDFLRLLSVHDRNKFLKFMDSIKNAGFKQLVMVNRGYGSGNWIEYHVVYGQGWL